MERKKKIPVLLLLLLLMLLLQVCSEDCPATPAALPTGLTCYTDYISKISCAWNSTKESDHTDACTLHGKRDQTSIVLKKTAYNASCHMEPADMSSPQIRRCTLHYQYARKFKTFHNMIMNLSCDPGKHILTVSFRPSCNIKLDPPGRPVINFTTVSWVPISEKHDVTFFTSELQWKRRDQSWSDSSVQTQTTSCKSEGCTAQLDPETLVQGETYEARTRVQTNKDARLYLSVWSDWGPIASWESPVGIIRPTPPAPTQLQDFVSGVGMMVAGAALTLILAGVLFKNDKVIWVYKKMIGQPPPDPGKSFLKDLNLQHWSPHFTSESLLTTLKTEDIDSVEVVSTAEKDALCSKEVALLDKMRRESLRVESNSSSFSNPSYSQLCPPPPPPPPPPPLPAESPELSGCQDKGAEKSEEEERIKEMQLVQLLSKGNSNNKSGQVQVVSDYEKVEKLHAERLRLQSLDSGVCCGEEVSHESLEADSVNASDGHEEEGPESREEGKDVVFQTLFGGRGGRVFGRGSIQVSSDYEQVHKLQPSSPELPSVDSGVNSGGEEQVSHEESLEDIEASTETTHFLFPPTRGALSRPVPSFSQMALSLSGTADSSRPLQPSGLSEIVGKAALLSLSRSMEASGDGYMPVRQESG